MTRGLKAGPAVGGWLKCASPEIAGLLKYASQTPEEHNAAQSCRVRNDIEIGGFAR